MHYNIKAHPTVYMGVKFRSRLEARWAAFFDLAKWKWSFEPIDLQGWTPDFRVEFQCRECTSTHTLLVEVKPYFTLTDFKGHPCTHYPYGKDLNGNAIPADSSAAFGANTEVTRWEMSHGGCGEVGQWVSDHLDCWIAAGNITQYKPQSVRELDLSARSRLKSWCAKEQYVAT